MAKKLQKQTSKPDELPIPYESLMGVAVQKPILSEDTGRQVEAAIANYMGQVRWLKWGMNSLRKGGSVILLVGPSGTGKTTIAKYLSKKVANSWIPMSMADIGGSDPGATERNTAKIFARGEKENHCPIFLDECDGILWSREKASADSMWMLAVINGILTNIEKYKGLVLMATNMHHLLDAALKRRVTDIIHVDRPTLEVRVSLWSDKIPAEFPFQPTLQQIKQLAKYKLTGAEIENAIIKEAKNAILAKRIPNCASLQNIVKEIELETQHEQ